MEITGMISIAMATYNGEKYIREQLDSILSQTVKDFELIVCDDCSKDSTVKILNANVNCRASSKEVICFCWLSDGCASFYVRAVRSRVVCPYDDFVKRKIVHESFKASKK